MSSAEAVDPATEDSIGFEKLIELKDDRLDH